MKKKDIVAVVAARIGSKRLPRKALLPFAGTTLVGHKIETLKQCAFITRVVVLSDSEEILDEARKHEVGTCLRPSFPVAHDMLHDAAVYVEGDVIVWAHPTNPLVRAQTYDEAVAVHEHLCGPDKQWDSVCSMLSVRNHAWFDGRPINYNPFAAEHVVAEDLKPVMFQNGAIFIQSRKQMLKNKYFFGRWPVPFVMNEYESLDIDYSSDYEQALELWGKQ